MVAIGMRHFVGREGTVHSVLEVMTGPAVVSIAGGGRDSLGLMVVVEPGKECILSCDVVGRIRMEDYNKGLCL